MTVEVYHICDICGDKQRADFGLHGMARVVLDLQLATVFQFNHACRDCRLQIKAAIKEVINANKS